MNSFPKVSVIIPTYNRPKTLLQALNSVLVQNYPDIEIIVVDDGSDINNNKFIVEQFSQVKYIYQDNKGPGAARNKGFIESRGEFIQFLDDDDLLLPEAIAYKARFLIEFQDYGVVYSDLLLRNRKGGTKDLFTHVRRPLPTGDIFNILISHNFIPIHSLMWRRPIFEEIGGFPESYGHEDWYSLIKASEITKFGFIDIPLGTYTIHKNSLTNQFSTMFIGKLKIHEIIVNSPRFQTSSPKLKANILSKFAIQEWAYGDQTKANEYLLSAKQLISQNLYIKFIRGLFALGRFPARSLLVASWLLGIFRRTGLRI